MKALSVIELAKLYGMTRQAVYKQINKGTLSKNVSGKIDLAEAIRVFGEPSEYVNHLQTTKTQKLSEVHLLEQQVYMLQKQLEIAQEREQFQREELKAKNNQLQSKDEQIEALQRLLGSPKLEQHIEEISDYPTEAIQKVVNEPQSTQQKQQPKSKRVGLFGRVLRAVLEE